MSPKLSAHLAAFTVNFIYGANFSIAKHIMPEFIKPFGFIVARVLPATLLFFITSLLLPSEQIKREDRWKLVACALFGIAINQLILFMGISLTHPLHVALIMTTNPVMVLLLAYFFLKEKISWNKVTGIVIAIFGAATLILFGKKFSLSNADIFGDFLIFINSLSFAVFTILIKPLMSKYNAITLTKWIFLISCFMILPFGFGQFTEIQWSSFTPEVWLCLSFVVIVVTYVAYLLNIYAFRELNASTVSAYMYLQPVVTTIIALLMGQGSPSALHAAAAILIFSGVFLVGKKTT